MTRREMYTYCLRTFTCASWLYPERIFIPSQTSCLLFFDVCIYIVTDLKRWLPDVCVCFDQRLQCLWDIAALIECLFDMIDNKLSRYLILWWLIFCSHAKEIILYCLLYLAFNWSIPSSTFSTETATTSTATSAISIPNAHVRWFCHHRSYIEFWWQFGFYQLNVDLH